jgi:glycosyltransferase involved in cell wall biosynthesis
VSVHALGILSLVLVVPMLALVTWNVLVWPAVTRRRAAAVGAVSVLIPARDESTTILDCLASVLRQGDIVREVLIYDDRSSDDTAAKVERAAATYDRIKVLRGGHLPPGWCGKPHACQRLAEAASGEWLLFLDADARLRAGGADRLLEDARTRSLTLLSAWPALRLESGWERLLMPVLNLVVFSLYPAPLALVRRDPSLGLAHGACILVHRETYLKRGGHGMVRDQLFEDSRLAQAWRAAGEHGLCLDGQEIVTVRMYTTASGIWRGFQKNFYPAFRHDLGFWAFLALHSAAFVVPFVLLVAQPSGVAAAAAGGGLLIRVLLALRFRHPLWSAFLHPLATCVLVAIGLTSRWRYRAASGVEWKGRRYGPKGEVV